MPKYDGKRTLAIVKCLQRIKNNKPLEEANSMNQLDKKNIINLSEHPLFEKNEVDCPGEKKRFCRDQSSDFIETLFRFLGDKRRTVVSFMRMKLDRKMRAVFRRDLERCRDIRDEARCVKTYFGYLRMTDAGAVLAILAQMLPGKIEALTYHGEAFPENRLMKFAKTFNFAHEDVSVFMLMMLMTRNQPGAERENRMANV